MGLLAGMIGICLIVQMILTVLPIPLSLLGALLLMLSVGFGWIGFGVLAGQWLARRFRITWPSALIAGVGTLAFMATINVASLLPILGDSPSVASAVIGLGAVFQTRFGLRKIQPAPVDLPDGQE